MAQTINEFISAIFQVVVLTLAPFIFYLFRKDKSQAFFKYIGLYKPTAKAMMYVLAPLLLIAVMGMGLVFINDGFRQAALSPDSVTGRIRSMGFSANSVVALLIMALIKTSLSEEIFFRGFLAKRLINKLGFKTGNFLQAAIFGLMHVLLFGLIATTAFLPLTIIFVFTSFAGWAIGYVNEKYANGSIIPGWIAHGLGNTISYFIIAFVI